MDSDRIARLTEQQRLCLRLVFAHLTSREIALRLGIEPNVVDQQVKNAVRALGAADRRAAARMLADHESGEGQPLVYQSLDIAIAPDPAMFTASNAEERLEGRGIGGTEGPGKPAAGSAPPVQPPALPVPILRSGPGDVGWLKRLAWIIGIVVVIAIAFGVMVSGLESVTRILRG